MRGRYPSAARGPGGLAAAYVRRTASGRAKPQPPLPDPPGALGEHEISDEAD
jgi:hypothetical protein